MYDEYNTMRVFLEWINCTQSEKRSYGIIEILVGRGQDGYICNEGSFVRLGLRVKIANSMGKTDMNINTIIVKTNVI